ncbi:hypothetical protein V8C37DRAFT_382501 [Trichoderma ceciliae]
MVIANREYFSIPQGAINNDDVNNDDDGYGTKSNDNEISTAIGGKHSASVILDIFFKNNKVTWGESYQLKQMKNVSFDLYMNISTNKAMFKLQSHIPIKGGKGKNGKLPIYIYMYPENVKTITYDEQPSASDMFKSTHYALRISMIQAPDFICPRGSSFESKDKTKTQLDLFRDLASVTEFVVHLDSFNAVIRREDIELLVDTFSSMRTEDRPVRDCRRANIATLYRGEGGEIIKVDKIESVAADPPPYTGPTPGTHQVSKKRRRTDSDGDSTASRMLSLLESLHSRFNKMEHDIGQVKDTIGDMERRLDAMSRSIECVKEGLSDAVDGGRSPCRYNTEERGDLLQDLNDKFDTYEINLNEVSKYTLNEVQKEADEAITEMREELRETISGFEKDALGGIEGTLKTIVTDVLQGASLQVGGNLVLNI